MPGRPSDAPSQAVCTLRFTDCLQLSSKLRMRTYLLRQSPYLSTNIKMFSRLTEFHDLTLNLLVCLRNALYWGTWLGNSTEATERIRDISRYNTSPSSVLLYILLQSLGHSVHTTVGADSQTQTLWAGW
jgi:hypothetical protein